MFSKIKKFVDLIKLLYRIDLDSVSQQIQVMLLNQYELINKEIPISQQAISSKGFRNYSQFEEDGIILFLLGSIGMGARKVVEIGIGDGTECMATNLIVNHGFEGFLLEGNERNAKSARAFFDSKKDCMLWPPKILNAWVTRSNINELLQNLGVSGDIELLSLDIDGNDYYVWEAISVIQPKLCIFETQDIIPSELSLTIPYEDNFNCWEKSEIDQDFRSVSLLAMKKLSESKGYRLIGSHRFGFNVFFMRNDVGRDQFPEVSVEQIHNNVWTKHGQAKRWPQVKSKPWVSI